MIPDQVQPRSEKTETDRLTWLRGEVQRQLSIFRKRRRRDKRKAFALQMSTVTLSACITVLLGLRVGGALQARLADVALVFGALVTVLAAAEVFFSHRHLWILRTGAVRRLEALDRHIDFYEAGMVDRAPQPVEVERYIAELERILADDHELWQRLRHATPGPQIGGEPSPGS